MPNAVEFSAFKLKKGVEVPVFLRIADEFNAGFLTKQKGYVSRELLVEGERWADHVLWETLEDIDNAFKMAEQDAVARKYLACINLNSCTTHLFSVEKPIDAAYIECKAKDRGCGPLSLCAYAIRSSLYAQRVR